MFTYYTIYDLQRRKNYPYEVVITKRVFENTLCPKQKNATGCLFIIFDWNI